MRIDPGRWLIVAASTVLSIALIAFAFVRPEIGADGLRFVARFPMGPWLDELPSHMRWVVPFALLSALLPALRAAVWARTLPPPGARFRHLFHAVALGGLVHNLAPGRLGVLASAWVLSRHLPTLPLPAALSSLLLGKLLEFGALLVATAGLAGAARLRGVVGGPTVTVLVLGLALLASFVLSLAAARRYAGPLGVRARRRGRHPRLAAALVGISEGLAAAGSLSRLAVGGLLSFGPVIAATLGYALGLRHAGVQGALLGGGLVLGAITFGQLLPGVPVGVGIYYFACASTARALGAGDEPAAALAVLSHLATVLTHSVVGLVAAIVHHDALGALLRLRGVLQPTPPTAERSG